MKKTEPAEEYKEEATEDAGNRSLYEAVLLSSCPTLAYPRKGLANAGWQIVHRHYGRFTEAPAGTARPFTDTTSCC